MRSHFVQHAAQQRAWRVVLHHDPLGRRAHVGRRLNLVHRCRRRHQQRARRHVRRRLRRGRRPAPRRLCRGGIKKERKKRKVERQARKRKGGREKDMKMNAQTAGRGAANGNGPVTFCRMNEQKVSGWRAKDFLFSSPPSRVSWRTDPRRDGAAEGVPCASSVISRRGVLPSITGQPPKRRSVRTSSFFSLCFVRVPCSLHHSPAACSHERTW